jgi:hypothetical protein
MSYIVVASYASDAERKRIDYALRGTEKIKGIVALVEDMETVEELQNRVASISLYKAEKINSPSASSKEILLKMKGSIDSISSVINFALRSWISKQKTLGASVEAVTKRGTAVIDFSINTEGQISNVKLIIRGGKKAVNFLSEQIEKMKKDLEQT